MRFVDQFARRNQPLADTDTFTRFYEDTHLNTYRYVMALSGGNQEQAEDITANAYLKAWKNRSAFQGSSDAALGWVITIARRLFIDQYRAQAARPLEAELDEEMPDDHVDVETNVLQGELTDQVITLLHQIPEQPREMVVLRYVLGWRVNQIAGHLKIPENTVAVTIHRAITRLQNLLIVKGVAHERQA